MNIIFLLTIAVSSALAGKCAEEARKVGPTGSPAYTESRKNCLNNARNSVGPHCVKECEKPVQEWVTKNGSNFCSRSKMPWPKVGTMDGSYPPEECAKLADEACKADCSKKYLASF